MAQYSYLTRNQLETIKSRVLDRSQDHKTEELKRLKELSDERAAKWPNTLQAQRARKERARIERMAAEEAERIEADRMEAELRSEHRRIQIERANKVLFDETDRVKSLHSRMLKCDAIKENEALIEFKKQIEVLKKAQEAAFLEQQRQAIEMAEAAELAKFEVTRQKALEQKAIQTQQLEDLKTRILAERLENKREGELLKVQAQQEIEETRAREQLRLAKARQLNEDTKQANRTLQAFKLQEMQLARKQDEAIAAYMKKKDELTAERKQREAERQAKKEAERQAVADIMERSFLDFKSKEESRLARDVAIAEERSAADEAARKQRIKDTIASLDRSNKMQLQQKAEARAKAKSEELAFMSAWEGRLKELKQEDAEEAAARFAEQRKLKQYQLHQADVKARRKAVAHVAKLQEAAQIQSALDEQEAVFQEYAQECLREYKTQGKTTVPMELYLTQKKGFDVLV